MYSTLLINNNEFSKLPEDNKTKMDEGCKNLINF